MTRREYSFRRGLRWQLWENIAMVAALPVIVLAAGFLAGVDPVPTIIFALCLAFIAASIGWENVWIFRNFARRVAIDENGIEATPFYGDSVHIPWAEITVRGEHERRDPLRGTFPQMRLIGRDGSRIVLDGEMTDAEELLEEVRVRTPHASPGAPRRWWERVFLPG